LSDPLALDRSARTVAVFVSPHGFGHAARACAVMEALAELDPLTRFEIFTLVPRWFFADSLTCSFSHHRLRTDIGLVQRTPLVEDPVETLHELSTFLPFEGSLLEQLAGALHELECRLVLCDISPLGIAVAERAGIRSVLVENFTWDWIYERYLVEHPAFAQPIAALAATFAAATVHIQSTPVCRRNADLPLVPPVSRIARTPRQRVRERLGVAPEVPAVLVTMGGVPWRTPALERLAERQGVVFVVPGGGRRVNRRGSLLTLPQRSGFFHPDLVHACDAVIGKLGYSTLAEVYAAGVPFAFVPRPTFRESTTLERFARATLTGFAITPEQLAQGSWIERVPELIERPIPRHRRANGAAAAARALHGLLSDR
jgi:hypothetical protein